MTKKQFIKTYKPKQIVRDKGILVTYFQKDENNEYPLYDLVKKLFPKGVYK